MEICETLNVQHVDLVNKEHPWDQFCHSLVNVAIHHLVNLLAKFIGDLSLLWFHQLAHHAQHVLPSLRPCVGCIKVVQCDILHNLLLLVHISLGQGNIFLGFKVKLGGVRVTATLALHCTAVGLNVDHIAHLNLFFLQRLVDCGVKFQLFCAFGCLQPNHNVTDGLPVAASWAFCLAGSQLCHFSFIHFLCLLYPEANGATKVLH